jgi:hypothetical protein
MHYKVTKINAKKTYCYGENFRVGPQLVKTVSHKINAWGDPDVDGRIILRWIFRSGRGLWGLDGAGSG